jgi:hypothetical protein
MIVIDFTVAFTLFADIVHLTIILKGGILVDIK